MELSGINGFIRHLWQLPVDSTDRRSAVKEVSPAPMGHWYTASYDSWSVLLSEDSKAVLTMNYHGVITLTLQRLTVNEHSKKSQWSKYDGPGGRATEWSTSSQDMGARVVAHQLSQLWENIQEKDADFLMAEALNFVQSSAARHRPAMGTESP